MSGTRHETQPVATIIYDNGSELTGTAVTTSDGSVGIRIPNEFFKTGLLPDGSMPEGVKSVSIRPKHPKGVLPLTDDMVYMAVTASLRDAVGLPLNEAADRYESWLNRVRRDAIEKWVDSLSMRESMRLHRKYLDRDGAGHLREEGESSPAIGRRSPVSAGSSPCPRMMCSGTSCSRTGNRSKSGPSYSRSRSRPAGTNIPSAWTCWSCRTARGGRTVSTPTRKAPPATCATI